MPKSEWKKGSSVDSPRRASVLDYLFRLFYFFNKYKCYRLFVIILLVVMICNILYLDRKIFIYFSLIFFVRFREISTDRVDFLTIFEMFLGLQDFSEHIFRHCTFSSRSILSKVFLMFVYTVKLLLGNINQKEAFKVERRLNLPVFLNLIVSISVCKCKFGKTAGANFERRSLRRELQIFRTRKLNFLRFDFLWGNCTFELLGTNSLNFFVFFGKWGMFRVVHVWILENLWFILCLPLIWCKYRALSMSNPIQQYWSYCLFVFVEAEL